MLKKFTAKLQALFSNPVVRQKVIFTALIFLVFRLLAHIPVPGVDLAQLRQFFFNNQFLNLLNMFSGGTLSQFSIVAVGINPYITASIILQLMAMVIPQVKEMQKDGETGRAKLNQYTRMLSVPLAIFQSFSLVTLLRSQNLVDQLSVFQMAAVVTSLVAGAMIVLWLGELVSEFGIGNGISMILFAGIVSQLPVTMAQTFSVVDSQQYLVLATFVVVFLAVIGLVVFMNEAVRKITIQYAKRVRGSKSFGGQTTHLPIKVNVAGVMPIIFAVSLMLVPSFLSRILIASKNESFALIGYQLNIWFSQTSWVYMLCYFLLVVVFSFVSAIVFFNADDISTELKKSGAFVPGIRPGGPTKKFLEFVVTRITLVGAVFLGLIALLPSIAQNLSGVQSLAVGGTSVLIVVSVVLETAKQLDSQLIGQNYEQYR